MATPQENAEKIVQAIGEMAGPISKVNTELGVTRKALNLINQDLSNSTIQFLAFFNEIQELQKRAVTEIGFLDFNESIERGVDLFKDLNAAGTDYAITQKNINDTIFDLAKNFEATGISVKGLDRAIAANSNLVERSKLVQFVTDLSFQQEKGSRIAARFSDSLIGLSIALKRPPGELLNLTQGLLNSNATFAQSEEVLKRLAVRSSQLGRMFNTSSQSLNQALGATFTIQQRQEQAARLSQIAGRLQLGIDTSGLLSSDPETRQKAIVQIVQQLNRRAKGLSPAIRQALIAALGPTVIGTALGPKGLRALGSRDFSAQALERAPRTAPADLDAARRGAATAKDVLEQRVRAKALNAAQTQLREVTRKLGSEVTKMTEATQVLASATVDGSAALSKAAGILSASAAQIITKLSAKILKMLGVIEKLPPSVRGPLQEEIDEIKAGMRELAAKTGAVLPGATK